MFPAAYDLKEFYQRDASQSAIRVIRRCLERVWPQNSLKGLSVLGCGYTLPFMPEHPADGRVLCALPAGFGPMHWQQTGRNRSCVVMRGALPFANDSFDRILLVHELEFAEDPHAVLDEIWRVLKPDGRILILVPNRLGFWARSDRTPFGFGRPYSFGQAHHLLQETRFSVERHTGILLFPPLRSFRLGRLLLRFCEPLAAQFPAIAGLLVIEASKRLYAPIPLRAERTGKRGAFATKPATQGI